MDGHSRAGAIAYCALVGFLIGFGLLGALSNGLPLLLLGIALAIVCAFGGWRVARRIAADMSMNPTVA